VDYERARAILDEEFEVALGAFRHRLNGIPEVPQEIARATDRLMQSSTQAYREALIGCALARLVDPEIDIQKPTTTLGEDSFSGRGVDERVVNPFLQRHEIPSSRGPYLSALRRGVELKLPVPQGQRDVDGFEALVKLVEALKEANETTARTYLRHLLCGFLRLREDAQISLVRVQHLDLNQYRQLLNRLLATPSGGRIPMIVAIATFQAIQAYFELDWEIEWQDINAPDIARNTGGDLTVTRDGEIILSVEVTERTIDAERVRATFRTKISPLAINDYIFFFTAAKPDEGAMRLARQYFAQGHHIAFLALEDWSINILGTLGPEGRRHFSRSVLEILDRNDVPREVKVAWNQILEAVVIGSY